MKSSRVKPAAHLDRLEEVLVLLTRQDLELALGTSADAQLRSTAWRAAGSRGARRRAGANSAHEIRASHRGWKRTEVHSALEAYHIEVHKYYGGVVPAPCCCRWSAGVLPASYSLGEFSNCRCW